MMKRIFTLGLFLSALMLNAQSIKLFYHEQEMSNNDTILEFLTDQENEISTYLGYQNMTGSPIEFRVRKEVLQLNEESTDLLFCIGECYTGNLSQPVTLGANEMVPSDNLNAFHATYTGGTDPAEVKFTFFLTENESDQVSFVIRYSNGTGMKEIDIQKSLRAYPNPAVSSVNIDFAAPNNHSYLVVKNLTGKEMFRTPIGTSGKMRLDISQYAAGVYFYGVESDGKMLCTKKLLVK